MTLRECIRLLRRLSQRRDYVVPVPRDALRRVIAAAELGADLVDAAVGDAEHRA